MSSRTVLEAESLLPSPSSWKDALRVIGEALGLEAFGVGSWNSRDESVRVNANDMFLRDESVIETIQRIHVSREVIRKNVLLGDLRYCVTTPSSQENSNCLQQYVIMAVPKETTKASSLDEHELQVQVAFVRVPWTPKGTSLPPLPLTTETCRVLQSMAHLRAKAANATDQRASLMMFLNDVKVMLGDLRSRGGILLPIAAREPVVPSATDIRWQFLDRMRTIFVIVASILFVTGGLASGVLASSYMRSLMRDSLFGIVSVVSIGFAVEMLLGAVWLKCCARRGNRD